MCFPGRNLHVLQLCRQLASCQLGVTWGDLDTEQGPVTASSGSFGFVFGNGLLR